MTNGKYDLSPNDEEKIAILVAEMTRLIRGAYLLGMSAGVGLSLEELTGMKNDGIKREGNTA